MRLTMRRALGRGAGRGLGRLPIQVGLTFTVMMALVGLIGFSFADTWVARRVDHSLRNHAAKYLALGKGRPVTDAVVAARILDWQQRKILSQRTYVLFGADGRRIAGRLDIVPPPLGYSNVRFHAGGRATQQGRALATRLPSGSLLVIVQHSEAGEALHALLPWVVLALSLAAAVMGVAVTLVFARLIAIRLAAAQETADAIAGGDLSRRVPTRGLDGLFADQAESLNRMLDRMDDLVRTQRLFASNLAHDLRTPLTRLRGILRNGADDPAILERAERECAAIIRIFDALLRLAEIESGRHPAAPAPLHLGALIEDVAETMEPVLADHGGALATGPVAPLMVSGDADLLGQMLVNLLDNVVTHTPPGTSARLSLVREGGVARITLSDNGPGLAEVDRARVLHAFERAALPAARGSGLGLAIAQAIVRFHGGTLALDDARPGLAVQIRLPLSPPGAAADCAAD
ncbi:HAMP domain-containing sensor histidine kinase [uncultured Sphingomonas sp.]|mgnify:CR=1 FL=1|uniref:HAMP domain-containing sensor histidine kinase n=1 Tax=uncultured Sphingomonas sp. TaxID=158754 RepID=UPI0025E98E52|nr:HAMP domain-containing sensor histidine kinase [uncultured Sphingomonas sp.]